MEPVIVFAGQGAQAVGMGKDLAEAYPECAALFARADQALGYSLSDVCFNGPIESLTQSKRCQPAIFVTSAACLAALQKEVPGFKMSATAGLSLGEYTALYAAGMLSFEDTLKILAARGQFMQEACEERDGTMVSVIGLPDDALKTVCAQAGVELANLNSADQTVLSGARANIMEAEKLAKAAGAKKTVVLNVAGAFHSSLMASAATKLAGFIADITFGRPQVPALSNVTGTPHTGGTVTRDLLVRQVTESVQWRSCVEWFRAQGAGRYVECGPGRVLSGLIKRIDSQAQLHNIQDMVSLKATAMALSGANQ